MERRNSNHQLYSLNRYYSLYYGPERDKVLTPCEEILDPDLCIGVIANGVLNPNNFEIRNRDRQVIKVSTQYSDEISVLTWPGKSGILLFDPQNCGPGVLKEIVTMELDSQYNRRHHLHISNVSKINTAGWRVFWAPLQLEGKVPHVRMVAESTLNSDKDPTEADRISLTQAFNKVC